MKLDTDRIDDAVLALLLLGLHEDDRVWKSFDWDAMNRLHEKRGGSATPSARPSRWSSRRKARRGPKRCWRPCSARRAADPGSAQAESRRNPAPPPRRRGLSAPEPVTARRAAPRQSIRPCHTNHRRMDGRGPDGPRHDGKGAAAIPWREAEAAGGVGLHSCPPPPDVLGPAPAAELDGVAPRTGRRGRRRGAQDRGRRAPARFVN